MPLLSKHESSGEEEARRLIETDPGVTIMFVSVHLLMVLFVVLFVFLHLCH